MKVRDLMTTEVLVAEQLLVKHLAGVIVHLDETLTMSARMAAFTGDLEWEARYRRFEPEIDHAIRAALRIAPESQSSAAASELRQARPRPRLLDAGG